MAMPEKGEMAPGFTLQDDKGDSVSLSDYLGKKVVLYFFPRADTPGCTKQACGFRDDYLAYQEKDVTILGVSPDTVEDEAKFRQKFELPFQLLADHDHKVSEAYGVWQKRPWGMGVVRTTFIIDEEGKISQIFKRVKPEGHSQRILALF